MPNLLETRNGFSTNVHAIYQYGNGPRNAFVKKFLKLSKVLLAKGKIYHPKKTMPIPHIAMESPEIGVMYFSSHSVFIKLNP